MSVNQSFSRALTNPQRNNIVNKLLTCRRGRRQDRHVFVIFIYVYTYKYAYSYAHIIRVYNLCIQGDRVTKIAR